ncbi:hypothetical protein LPJ74_000150 [Coemansia sp. RSA 1843]|nr:hypothetical protein LPJ74_000150 [Coemansia sp. RSA 1843]
MQSQLSPQAAVGVGSNEPLPSSENQSNANGEFATTAPESIPTLPGFEKQAPTVRYSIDELLLLRDSSSSQIPIDFSPYTPLRQVLGSQLELPQGARIGKKVVAANPFMGLENIPRTHKDVHQTSQKTGGGATQHPRGQSAGMGRMTGASKVSGRSQGAAIIDNGIEDHRKHGGLGARGANMYPNTATSRDGHGKAGGSHPGSRHHNSSHDGNRTGGALSWRSSTANQAPAGNHASTDTHGNATLVQGIGQPEWMDNDMLYDESLNAQRMQDMEDWKRRMKENSGAPHSEHMQDDMIQSQPIQHVLPSDANNGLARGSRFLRLFSESAPQQSSGDMGAQINDAALQAHKNAYHNTATAAASVAYANGAAQGIPEFQPGQGTDGSGDQISKLFKVLGDRISVSNPQMAELTATQNHANKFSGQSLTTTASSNLSTNKNQTMPPSSMALHDSSISAISHPQSVLPTTNAAELKGSRVPASNTSQQMESAAPAPHRIKTASPAPINEALRGIVPTSVFRKSVQSSSGSGTLTGSNGGGRQHQNPESTTSSRSGTPAKSLPSWLVELSRGRSASPSNQTAAGQTLMTNESLGSQDLVDVLEREFPALGIRPQATDNQSISSLSVQASVGVPSEGTGGDSSVRHSTIEVREQENQQTTDPASQPEDGSSGQLQAAAATGYQMAPPNVSADVPGAPRDIAGTSAPGISQVAGVAAIQNPGTMPSADPMHMQHVLPPQAMMDMPPAMMMPDGTMVPGMVHHPSMMGAGQMPPMAMLPPPHHAMGFHPNMMFGMMPPHPGMFGNMPPASIPMSVGQMNGIPGPTSEHQQQMIKMMMMSDMPPGMVFGQMNTGGAPPQ